MGSAQCSAWYKCSIILAAISPYSFKIFKRPIYHLEFCLPPLALSLHNIIIISHMGAVFYSQKVSPHLLLYTTFLVVWNSNSGLISISTAFLPCRYYQNRPHMVLKGGLGS